MPVLVGSQGVNEAGAFFGRFAVPFEDESCGLKDAVGGRRADGDDIQVEHHKGEVCGSLRGERGRGSR